MRLLAALVALALHARASAAHAQEAPSPRDVRALEAAGRFDEAAAQLEQRSTNGAMDVARAWIDRALDYRLALGDIPSAARDLRALARVAPAAHVAARELALGEVLARQGRWRESAAFHAAWLARWRTTGGAASRGIACVALGNAWRMLGDEARALAAYRAARALPRAEPPRVFEFFGGIAEAGEAPLDGDGSEPPSWGAEAMFWQVEPRFRRLVARARPAYRGPSNRRTYDRWVATVLARDTEARQFEIDAIAQAYQAIVNEHAPAWEGAAYDRLATALLSHAQAQRGDSPPPDQPIELRDAWLAITHPPWVPHIDLARACLLVCVRSATVRRDAGSIERCERGLDAIEVGRLNVSDELAPALDHGSSAPRDLPAVMSASHR